MARCQELWLDTGALLQADLKAVLGTLRLKATVRALKPLAF
jgi:hypothetical protein